VLPQFRLHEHSEGGNLGTQFVFDGGDAGLDEGGFQRDEFGLESVLKFGLLE